MKEKHGIVDARKLKMFQDEETQAVSISDGDGEVRLSMQSSSYPAGLTPQQARFIARALVESAKRVEQK